MRNTQRQHHAGFTIMEIVMYISLLTIVTTLLVSTTIELMRSYAYVTATSNVAQAGAQALDRFTREVRLASAVDVASVFDTSPGTLILTSIDDGNQPTTVQFGLTNDRLTVQMGSAPAAPLTPADVTVSSLVFRHAVGTHGDGIGISMTASVLTNIGTTTKEFRTFVLLDGS